MRWRGLAGGPLPVLLAPREALRGTVTRGWLPSGRPPAHAVADVIRIGNPLPCNRTSPLPCLVRDPRRGGPARIYGLPSPQPDVRAAGLLLVTARSVRSPTLACKPSRALPACGSPRLSALGRILGGPAVPAGVGDVYSCPTGPRKGLFHDFLAPISVAPQRISPCGQVCVQPAWRCGESPADLCTSGAHLPRTCGSSPPAVSTSPSGISRPRGDGGRGDGRG